MKRNSNKPERMEGVRAAWIAKGLDVQVESAPNEISAVVNGNNVANGMGDEPRVLLTLTGPSRQGCKEGSRGSWLDDMFQPITMEALKQVIAHVEGEKLLDTVASSEVAGILADLVQKVESYQALAAAWQPAGATATHLRPRARVDPGTSQPQAAKRVVYKRGSVTVLEGKGDYAFDDSDSDGDDDDDHEPAPTFPLLALFRHSIIGFRDSSSVVPQHFTVVPLQSAAPKSKEPAAMSFIPVVDKDMPVSSTAVTTLATPDPTGVPANNGIADIAAPAALVPVPVPAPIVSGAASGRVDDDETVKRMGPFRQSIEVTKHSVLLAPVHKEIVIADTKTFPERWGIQCVTDKLFISLLLSTFILFPLGLAVTVLALLSMVGLPVGGLVAEQVWIGMSSGYFILAGMFLGTAGLRGHPGVMMAIVRNSPGQMISLNTIRLMYTIGCGWISPTTFNLSSLFAYQMLVLYITLYDASIVMIRLRLPRKVYKKMYGTGSPVGKYFIGTLVGAVVVDIAHHMFLLYNAPMDSRSMAELGRLEMFSQSMALTPRAVATSTFMASLVLMCRVVFSIIKAGGMGSRCIMMSMDMEISNLM